MSSATDALRPGLVFATLAGAAVVKYSLAAFVRWRHSQKFKLVGQVTSLTMFPVKSCSGYSVQSAECTRLGLRQSEVTDRHFLVIKPNGEFLHQRVQPRMALIKVSPCGDQLEINAPGMPPIKVSKDQLIDKSKVKPCRVWAANLEGLDCGDEVAEWFSTFLNMSGLRLLYSAPGLTKKDMTEVTYKPWGNPSVTGDMAAYSDFGGYLIVSENSVHDLNRRLSSPVTFRNFRPNIVVRTDAAFQEDTWLEIKVGDTVRMRMLDYCTRCTMTTVDPELGVKSSDGEPLKTLKSFRCFAPYGTFPCFGVNATVDVTGPVRIGDPVYAIQRPVFTELQDA
ncbi:mitochondrial amidoxime reducing component 2-like [Gigantopelta aegis]|uniref:mitochondrial amidoxime reducing component 2-like n=1 Tax=Gigantopelta aegis TaxID=1735272 RepID=UPI001B88CFC5|nr:mitochondrial amidoxime reducing component 2-like [Gigantopelta aegis]